MTTNDIITVARRFLQDTVSPYHWTDEELKSNLQLAIVELNKIRPETRYVNYSLTDGIVLPASATDVIDVDDRYKEALACYVSHLCYLDDSTDNVSLSLSETFLQKFQMRAIT